MFKCIKDQIATNIFWNKTLTLLFLNIKESNILKQLHADKCKMSKMGNTVLHRSDRSDLNNNF